MKTQALCVVIFAVVIVSCGKTVNQPFTGLFSGEITPSVGGGSGGGGNGSSGIQILSTATMTSASKSPVAVGNLIYDGTRLIVIDTIGGWPINNTVTFDYISTNLTLQSHSTASYNAGVWATVTAPGPLAGQTAVYWAEYGSTSTHLTVRDDASGTIQSTTAINFSNYGCSGNTTFTYCGGDYYGVCTTSSGYMRLFSCDTSGTMQSAVTTNIATTTDTPNAVTCYNGSYLLLVTSHDSGSYSAFYKYDLNFNLMATDSRASASFPPGLQTVVGIATDGTNLYLQGVNNSANPPTYMLGVATLGNLK